jgi:hypothetical protein
MGTLAARVGVEDGARDDFLAGAGFAEQEDGQAVAGGFGDEAAQRGGSFGSTDQGMRHS